MKKIFALVLALCMLTACVFAEEAVNSKSAGTGTVVTGEEAAEEELQIAASLSDVSEELLNTFAEAEAPIKCFSEETEAAADEMIGGDSEALQLIELKNIDFGLSEEVADALAEAAEKALNNADGEAEKIDMVLSFDEDFSQYTNIIGVITANEEELLYKMEVNEDGDLTFELPVEDAQKIAADEEAFIAILAD